MSTSFIRRLAFVGLLLGVHAYHSRPKSEEHSPKHAASSSDLFEDDDQSTTLESIARLSAPAHVPIEQPQTSDTEILEHLLTRGYDHRVRPPGEDGTIHGGPVVVSVNMLLRSISKIDNVNMEYSVQLTFRESWVDKRLSFGVKGDAQPDFLILTAGQEIWMPDSFFQNEKQAYKHMIDKPNVLIRVHKDGTILYSVRISLVLSCPMHLQYYPMDVQQCFIDLASYAYTTKDIEYVWKEETPVQLKAGLSSSLPSFQLTNTSTTYCTSKTNTGSYSCLRTIIQLRRQFSYYLLQLYIPSCMLVIVSWVSFWIDRTAVPARVTLGVTTLLTMTTQSSGINAKLPPVAYIKAIDVWIGACMTFIFCALLEFAWVTYIANKQDANKRARTEREKAELPFLQNSHNDVWVPREVAEQEREVMTVRMNRRQTNSVWKWIKTKTEWNDKSKRADLISRVMFPVLFLTFNISYWTHYGQYGVAIST
ncbi:Ig-like domain-containing protein [Caenorhabditis elegans]|uniref:Ig-like domain-containing protein n=1 Tax=Caenorhabditis elegans TaxID=6239 RepID=Q95PJ6_CAEEL|nr:Ig-like domain-containing protein [Caenorhabditis elegans]CAB03329.1 Ig-like domain-containing protein [Caenorhabditis elegans]|eukprot:NP_001024077.1 Uncharacterized protein CELE_R11G10.1 [Caenorhabditis elegans]